MAGEYGNAVDDFGAAGAMDAAPLAASQILAHLEGLLYLHLIHMDGKLELNDFQDALCR